MFWGVILESGKRYSQTVEQSYHLTMASLEPPADGKTPSKYVSLMIEHEKAEYMLCTLEHERNLQVHLDHMFVEGEEVTYFLNGDGTVHLTGYVIGDDQFDDFDEEDEEMDDEESDDDDEDEDEDIPKLNKIPIGKRKTETISEPFGKKMKVEIQKDIRRETSPIKGAKPEEKSVNAKVKDERSLSPVKGNIKVENVNVKNAKDESDDDSDEDDDDDDEEEDEEEASEGDLGLIDKEAVEAEESDDNDEESDDNDEEESDESDDSDNDDKSDNKGKKQKQPNAGILKQNDISKKQNQSSPDNKSPQQNQFQQKKQFQQNQFSGSGKKGGFQQRDQSFGGGQRGGFGGQRGSFRGGQRGRGNFGNNRGNFGGGQNRSPSNRGSFGGQNRSPGNRFGDKPNFKGQKDFSPNQKFSKPFNKKWNSDKK